MTQAVREPDEPIIQSRRPTAWIEDQVALEKRLPELIRVQLEERRMEDGKERIFRQVFCEQVGLVQRRMQNPDVDLAGCQGRLLVDRSQLTDVHLDVGSGRPERRDPIHQAGHLDGGRDPDPDEPAAALGCCPGSAFGLIHPTKDAMRLIAECQPNVRQPNVPR